MEWRLMERGGVSWPVHFCKKWFLASPYKRPLYWAQFQLFTKFFSNRNFDFFGQRRMSEIVGCQKRQFSMIYQNLSCQQKRKSCVCLIAQKNAFFLNWQEKLHKPTVNLFSQLFFLYLFPFISLSSNKPWLGFSVEKNRKCVFGQESIMWRGNHYKKSNQMKNSTKNRHVVFASVVGCPG